jgi:UDP-apiose/xylose synthase
MISGNTASADRTTITVVGCGGFIGSHLLEALLARGRSEVVGIDIASEKIKHLMGNPRFAYVQADMHDLAKVRPFIERSGTVFLLAALCNPALYNTKPIEVIDINCTGTLPLIALCAEAGARIVYFSTSEVYGKTIASVGGPSDTESILLREDGSPLILGPVSAQRWSYACAKQLVERYIFGYAEERGLHYTIVRPFNFIGPRMDFIPGIDGEGVPRVLACFLAALMRGEPLKLVDGGKNRRCFTYIDDAIDACMRILDRPEAAKNQIFNIGNPANESTIAGLAVLMARLWRNGVPEDAGRTVPIEEISGRDFYGPGYEDSDRRLPDIGKARTLLGWEPKTDLATAIERCIHAYRAYYSPRMEAN